MNEPIPQGGPGRAAHPLDQEERDCIAEIDVYGHGAARTADRLFLSAETVKRRRRTGYGRIAAALSG